MPVLDSLRKIAVGLDPASRRIRRELRHVAQRLPPADRMLDLGCGRSPYTHLFRHRECVKADLNAAADVRCDATALPFAEATFDLVLCSEVLEHVPDPDHALANVRRVLRPGGALVLTTPLTWGVHEDIDFHRWTRMGLQHLLGRHQFEVDSIRARGGIFLTMGSMLQIVPWQLYGPARERRWWQTALFVLTFGLLLPPAMALAAVDRLDRRQAFTHGYVILCRPWGHKPIGP